MNRISNLSKVLKHSSLWMVLFLLLCGSNVFGGTLSLDLNSATAPTPSEGTLGYTTSNFSASGFKLSSTGNAIWWILDESTFSEASFTGWINSTNTTYNFGYCFSTDGGSTWGTEYKIASDGTKTVGAYALSNIPSGANAIKIIRDAGTSTYVNSITLTTSSTSPTLTVTPTTLTDVNKNLYGSGSYATKTFTVSGSNLTADAIITVPTNFEISTDGGSTWKTSATIVQTSGTINSTTVSVRCSGVTTGNYSGSVSIVSTGATDRAVSVSGTVLNTTPLNCPANIATTYLGPNSFTASWDVVANAIQYKIYVYKASDLTTSVAEATTSGTETTLSVSGLEGSTAYVYKVQAIADGNNYANSNLCSGDNITTKKSTESSAPCITEDFSGLADATSCPTSSSSSPTTVLRATSFCSTPYYLDLAGGVWTANSAELLTSSYAGNGVYLKYSNSTEGSLVLPSVDLPKKITFRVKSVNDCANQSDTKYLAYGIQVLQGSTPITSGITVDGGSELVVSTVTKATAPQLRDNGVIQVGNDSYHLVSVTLIPSKDQTITITTAGGNTSAAAYIDDVTLFCDPQELTISPDLSGLNYVEDLGPSEVATVTMTGTFLPQEDGTATITCKNKRFEFSLDGGITWQTSTATFSYTGIKFTKTMLVRLPSGLKAGASGSTTYSDIFTLTSDGYNKTDPSITVTGKVTLYPITANCGESVTLLNLKGTESTLNLVDAEAGSSWTTAATVKTATNVLNGYSIQIPKNATITSPSVSASEYDFKTLSFDCQPLGSSTTLTVQLTNGTDYVINKTVNAYTDKANTYTFSVDDLDKVAASGSYYIKISTDGSSYGFNLWNVKLTGAAKRKITFEPTSITDFVSYQDCPSDLDTLKVYGTCLDDNSSLDFSSKFGYYQVSSDGTTWKDIPTTGSQSFSYTGEYPVAGMKLYVRQKTGLVAGTVNDVITVTNGGKGSVTLPLAGTSTSSSAWTPADGSKFTYSSITGVADTVCIPIVGDEFCSAPTAKTSCTGLTVSNCKTGSYGTETSFSNTYTTRNLYLKFTPSTLTDCEVDITAGGETHKVYVTWNGTAAIGNGVQFSSSAVEVSSTGSVQVNKKGSGDPIVTVNSTKFDFSMGNPAYGDFVAITSFKLSELQGTLFIKPKSTTTTGASEDVTFATAGGDTATLTVIAK